MDVAPTDFLTGSLKYCHDVVAVAMMMNSKEMQARIITIIRALGKKLHMAKSGVKVMHDRTSSYIAHLKIK